MIAFAVSVLFAAQAATPPPTDTPDNRQPIVVVGHPPAGADRVVCRTIVETGSRIAEGRLCQRQSDWEADRRRNQLDAERMVADTWDYNQQLIGHGPAVSGRPQ